MKHNKGTNNAASIIAYPCVSTDERHIIKKRAAALAHHAGSESEISILSILPKLLFRPIAELNINIYRCFW
jgi:hypothetical protein